MSDSDQPRRFGFWTAYFLVIAAMVGAGILTSSGFTLKDTANPAGLLFIWAVGGVLALCGTLTIAELATMLPHAGSDYLFVRQAYGRSAGVIIGWGTFVLGFAAPTAVIARLSASYLMAPLEGWLGELDFAGKWAMEPALATVFVGVLVLIHCLGHRESGQTQIISTLLKVSLLVLLAIAGLLSGGGDWSHWTSSHLPDRSEAFTLGVGFVYVTYAYTGWNAAAYVAGEVAEPERLLPRSLIAGCCTVIVLYMLVNLAYIYALDPQAVAELSYPEVQPVAVLAAKTLFGTITGHIVAVLLGLGLFASVSAYLLAGPRIAYAMAVDGAFPRFAARLGAGSQVPVAAILAQGVLAIGMAWSGPFLDILNYTSVGLATIAGLVVASIFPLRGRTNLPHPFRMPLYPLPPILFLLVTGWIVLVGLMNSPQSTLWSLLTIAIGWPVAWLILPKGMDDQDGSKFDSSDST